MKLYKTILLILLGTQFFYFAHADTAKIKNPDNGHEYQRFDTPMSWQEAKEFCENEGGHLATITSPEEDNFVYSNLVRDVPEGIEMCWIGGTDEVTEGTWKWVTGETWSYTNWSQYVPEPNNCIGIEHYLTYFTKWDDLGREGTWNDLGVLGSQGCGCRCPDKTYNVYTICEWDDENKTITVTHPNGGENWVVGSKPTIKWTSTGPIDNVKIQISTDNGRKWSKIKFSVPNKGSFTPYDWTVPNELSNQCLIKISEPDGNPYDKSDSTFSIVPGEPSLSGKLQIKSPSGETWDINKIQVESYVKILEPINLIIKINDDGTYNSGASLLPTGTYEVISVLGYYDYITVHNGHTPPPQNGRIVRTAKWTGTISIQEGVPQTLNIDYHLPVFLIHGIRSGYTTWDNWAWHLTNRGYIAFTPNHHYRWFKTIEAVELLIQYNLDINGLFDGPNPDVYFICHSEGGVATRALVNISDTIAQKIKQIYTIGTPHSGTDAPLAILYQLDKVYMCLFFNRIYPNFNNVPVYAISGHGFCPYINDCDYLSDGLVFWNPPEPYVTDSVVTDSVNVSPFFIKVLNIATYTNTASFAGFSPVYIDNGHHFCYNHMTLISAGLHDILAGTIIPSMNTGQILDYNERSTIHISENPVISSDPAMLPILKEIFYLDSNTSKEFQVNVSSTELATFYALIDLGDIELILTDPDGIQISSDNYSSYNSIDYSNTEWGLTYSITNPKTGLWKVKITSDNADDFVALEVREEGTWGISGYTNKTEYSPNSRAILNAEIVGTYSAIDISQFQVTSYDENENEILTINLYDDGFHNDQSSGDGIYGNTCKVPMQEGYYRLKYNAQGSIQGKNVQRECTWGYIVSGTVSDYEITLTKSNLYFGASGQSVTCSQSFFVDPGNVNSNWTVTCNQNWIICTPDSGTGTGNISVSVDPTGLSEGSYSGTITVTDPNASNSPQTISVVLNVYNSNQISLPFGDFSTPIDGSTVRSSIPVTGWVLDDIEVENVKIYRSEGENQVYIGDAVFVEGARPDVEQTYPEYPLNYRAGWGYMMLTNFLPNGGNGTFIIHAIATDVEGHQVTLGSKTIICDNANAVKPFGAIDTPGQGGAISGSSFRNQGWVLTPLPNSIPTDGSTINVYVDGVNLGNPTYNVYREDIATLFPDYANSNGAQVYFDFDTTGYDNGVHNIYWTAEDSAGNSDGIGSRYFTIQNTGYSGSSNSAAEYQEQTRGIEPYTFSQVADIPVNAFEPIKIQKNFRADGDFTTIYANEEDVFSIKMREVGRIVIELSGESSLIGGFIINGNKLKPLPIGSTIDTKRGIFYWHPGPGFIGEYRLLFIEKMQNGEMRRKNITVNIEPKFAPVVKVSR